MFCKNCGTELDDSQKVCSNCGTPIEDAAPVKVSTSENDKKLILQIFAGLFALINVIMFLVGFFKFFGSIFNYFRFLKYSHLMSKIFGLPLAFLNLLAAVSLLITAIVLVLLIMKWKKEESQNFFILLVETCVLTLVLDLVCTVISALCSIGSLTMLTIILNFFGIFGSVLRSVILCGGIFGILYLMNINPIAGINISSLKDLLIKAPKSVFSLLKGNK